MAEILGDEKWQAFRLHFHQLAVEVQMALGGQSTWEGYLRMQGQWQLVQILQNMLNDLDNPAQSVQEDEEDA
jgi:hypothetical protein